MRSSFHQKFFWVFPLLFAVSAAVAPGASLEHELNHLEAGYAASIAPGLGFDSFGDEADPDAHCDLCDALTNGRSVTSLAIDGPTDRLESAQQLDSFDLLLLPRSAQYGPESQRAPPLS